MHLDPEFLSRLQFAWVVGWHILLPAFTIGLASFIAFLEGAYALTRRAVFLNLSQFWLRIFAISFGMGVVTGIVMPFQFGTNWSRLRRRRRQHHLAAVGLRRPDRVLSGSDVSRRAAVRPQAGAAGDAFRRRSAGRRRHAVVGVLDPCHQQLDADAGRLRGDRRPVLPERLVRDRLQPVAAVSLRAHGQRLLCHHRLRRARRRRLHGAARTIAGRRPHDAAAGVVVPRHLRADPGRARRPCTA